ncbi:MAG: endonuclease V [Gammaproteobacteria bacterium]|nr:MAG: endonuclease V [Gammaproteobacteria bacterium]
MKPSLATPPSSPAAARELQTRLAMRVRLENTLPADVRTVAGLDAGIDRRHRRVRGAAVLCDARSLEPLAVAVAERPIEFPYVPGLLSFRELPALLEALDALPQRPDLLLCDGQGVAHPRRFGLAAHLGVVAELPSIGVAKSRLCGSHAALGPGAGDCVPLYDGEECIGHVLRSRAGCRPLYVSAGHRLDQITALDWVRRCLKGRRLPEPIRLADRLASRRRGASPAAPARRR